MTTTQAGIRLGVLATAKCPHYESEGAGSPGYVAYRPLATSLKNDGVTPFWMLPGTDYDLEHDGTGWRVTCRSWPEDGHVYRLVHFDSHEPRTSLLLAAATYGPRDSERFSLAAARGRLQGRDWRRLDPQCRYQLRAGHAGGPYWDLYEVS